VPRDAYRCVRVAFCADREARGLPLDFFARDESAVIGIFPNGQLRAGRAPRFHHFFVAALACCQPLQEVDYESFNYGVGHGVFS
jgi:hypothetical protein